MINKVRVLYNTDGTVSIIKPVIQSKKETDTEEEWLNRVFNKATPDGIEFEDIDASELPDHKYRDCWVKNETGGVKIDIYKKNLLIREKLEITVDKYIDTVAQERGYDSRLTCALRASYENPWKEEGVVFGKWMDSCYTQCYKLIQDIESNTAEIPTEEELISSLPEIVWP